MKSEFGGGIISFRLYIPIHVAIHGIVPVCNEGVIVSAKKILCMQNCNQMQILLLELFFIRKKEKSSLSNEQNKILFLVECGIL